jgi:hypothetical protein
MAASAPNSPRQSVIRSSCPPMTGATIGAVPLTRISSAKTFAATTPS